MYNKIKIIRRKKLKLLPNKYGRMTLQRVGDVYFEINYWDGAYWQTAKEEPATLVEARAIANRYI